MNDAGLSLKQIRKSYFINVYEDFLLDRNMDANKYRKILELAVLFLNCTNSNISKLGYRILVIYCNRNNNYKPLYDVAINKGLIPITNFIDKFLTIDEDRNIFTEMNAALSESFLINGIYCTLKQKELIDFYENFQNYTVAVVAPTSYGKTDLILNTISRHKNKSICIITPSKSLLAQTKARILKSNRGVDIKVITQPEMYNYNDVNPIVLMTQERVLRLLKISSNIDFSYVIVDEAHSLLDNNDRAVLLASVIKILEHRNKDTVFKFLTPFLCDLDNLHVRHTDLKIEMYKVDEYIKTEKLYYAEFRERHDKFLFIYDQFLNCLYKECSIANYNELSFIQKYAGSKNIIYFNKPKDIESFTLSAIGNFKIVNTPKIREACESIADYVHPKYRLIEALKKGIIYHHGDVLVPVRMYIEKLYTEVNEISFVITSSTLLEGINLPADKMFILDNKKGRKNLSPSDLKNLIGRVCRFNRIFDPIFGGLDKLEPQIYLVVGKYFSADANIKKFLFATMNIEKKVTDNVENVLLKNTQISDHNQLRLDKANEFLENYENGTIPGFSLRKVQSKFGKICILNNISEFDVFTNEGHIKDQIESLTGMITDTATLIEQIFQVFIRHSNDDFLNRFKHVETRRFYTMFLNWRISNISLGQMIASFIGYWKGLLSQNGDPVVYVGRWGDLKRESNALLWTDISKKSDDELINLAIVRIKEEQDFVDNILIKFVEVFNDLKLIENRLYLLIKYGTDDERVITCVKNGLSLSLSKLLIERYGDYIKIDVLNNTMILQENLPDVLRKSKENQIMICELEYYL